MAEDTYLVTENNFVAFENVWVKDEETSEEQNVEYINIQPLVLIHEPEPEEKKKTATEKNATTTKKVKHRCDRCDYTTQHKHCMDRHARTHTNERPYKCDHCDLTTKTKTHLKRHIEVKHKDESGKPKRIYACDVCEYTTHTNQNLYNHKKKHNLPKKFKCGQCKYMTAFRVNFKRHMKTHKRDLFQCDKCPYQSKYSKHMDRHLSRMHNGDSKDDNSCDLCGFTTKKRFKLREHIIRSKRNNKLICECDFSTFYKCEMRKHKENSTCESDKIDLGENSLQNPINDFNPPVAMESSENQNYKCKKCSLFLKSSGELQRHLLEVHNNVKRKYCNFCDYTTHDTYRLNKHLRLSKGTVERKCLQCDFRTFLKCEMRKHNRSHFTKCEMDPKNEPRKTNVAKIPYVNVEHSMQSLQKRDELIGGLTDLSCSLPRFCNEIQFGAAEPPKQNISDNFVSLDHVELKSVHVLNSYDKDKPFQCVLCDFKSHYKVSVQKHYLRRHTSNDARPYKCTNCNLATKTKDKMCTHVKNSKSENILSCKTCPFTTYFKCSLAFHEKTHYKFKCGVCNRIVAKNKAQLKRHHETYHSNFKLKCSFCDFTTVIKENLINHENIHKGIRPFKCHLCDYAAVRMPLLTNHYKIKHQKEMKEINDLSNKREDTSVKTTDISNNDKSLKTSDTVENFKKYEESRREPFVSNEWQTYYTNTIASWNAYQADCNTASSISVGDWQDSSERMPHYHMLDSNPDMTPQYESPVEHNMMEVDNVPEYKYNIPQQKPASAHYYPNPDTGVEHKYFREKVEPSESYTVANEKEITTVEIHKSGDEEKPFKCASCNFKSKYRHVVQTHFMRRHTGKDFRPFKCIYCDHQSLTKDKIVAHAKRSQSEKMLSCAICLYTTYFRCALTSHKKTHLKYKCRICKQHFEGKVELEEHQAQSHAKFKLKCHFCDFMAMTKDDLVEHENIHRSLKPYHCDSCKYGASRKKLLINHIRKKHSHQMRKIIRKPVEGKPEIGSLDNMIETALEPLRDVVSENYIVNEQLNVNVVGVLPSDDTEKPFKCLLCEYKSQYKTSVQRHYIRRHTDNNARPFQCINCGYGTKTKDKIAIHITRSESDKKLNCAHCEFSSYFKCAYNSHRKIHFTAKCDFCEYVCSNKYHLETHYATYHSEHKLKCRFCEFTTARKLSLRNHENIHKGVKPYKCKLCDYSAVRRPLVTNHLKNQHPEADLDAIIFDKAEAEQIDSSYSEDPLMF